MMSPVSCQVAPGSFDLWAVRSSSLDCCLCQPVLVPRPKPGSHTQSWPSLVLCVWWDSRWAGTPFPACSHLWLEGNLPEMHSDKVLLGIQGCLEKVQILSARSALGICLSWVFWFVWVFF